MATNFPTGLDTLVNPSGTATTDNPSLSSAVGNAGDSIEALEAKVGIDSSAVNSSHDRKLSNVTGSDKAASVTGSETLTNKTLTSPALTTPTITAGVAVTSFDMNGTELILDVDADTSITADNDDQIDIRIAANDDFQFTANDFTALSGSVISTNTINETTSASGVTIDGVLNKDNEVVLDNNKAIKAKNTGGTAENLIKKDGSNQTVIGDNSVRATRFVAVTPVSILAYATIGDADWHDLDVTSDTSDRAFMIIGVAQFRGFAINDQLNLRKNGTSLSGDLVVRARATATATNNYHAYTCELDSGQILEYQLLNGASGGFMGLILTGYWEYVD